MNNKIRILLIAFSFGAVSPSSFSQTLPPLESYYIVTLKGDVVKDRLATPGFSYFDFTFKQLANKSYILTGHAYDANNNKLGNLITLEPMVSRPTRPLRNIHRGHLTLNLATMNENNVDGSENYVLTPKKCKDRSGDSVDYVSYRFSNKVSNKTSFLSATKVTEFDLNPSPPY